MQKYYYNSFQNLFDRIKYLNFPTLSDKRSVIKSLIASQNIRDAIRISRMSKSEYVWFIISKSKGMLK